MVNAPAYYCPMCQGRMSAMDKTRKGDRIHHRYDCENPACPARKDDYIVSLDTIEIVLRYRRRPVKSTGRTKSSKVPDIRQKSLDMAE